MIDATVQAVARVGQVEVGGVLSPSDGSQRCAAQRQLGHLFPYLPSQDAL